MFRLLTNFARSNGVPSLFSDVDGDGLAQPFACPVQIVTELQGQLVLAWRQLHVDFGFAVAEVHPRRRAFDDGRARREAVLIDADVMVPHAWPRRLDGPLWNRGK